MTLITFEVIRSKVKVTLSAKMSFRNIYFFQGIVEPHSVLDVPLIIEAQTLEEQDLVVHVAIFGSPDPPMVCAIRLCYMSVNTTLLLTLNL